MRGIVRSSILALTAAAAMLGPVGPVAASGAGHIAINTGLGWGEQSHGPLFDFVGMGPGWTGTSNIAVRNDSGVTSSLTLASADIVDDENGCNHPESAVDPTCAGPNAGELGREMVFTVYSTAKPSDLLWRGSLYDLRQGAALDDSVKPNQVDDFSISAELPFSTGNETQTDRLAFTLVFNLSGATVAVEGTKTTRPPSNPITRAIDQLPFTGTPAQRLVAAALTMLLIGTVLALLFRRRRKGPEPV